MRYSLVLATIHRTAELERFMVSLYNQPFADFELLIVDQNRDGRLLPIIETYLSRGNLIHLRSEPGLSKARNRAMGLLNGEIVVFPDDDCWYPVDLLATVDRLFRDHPEWDGLTGRSVDRNDLPSGGRWDNRAGRITTHNVWRRATSYSIFLRRETIARLGGFDESLGVGAETRWGSGEDIDYLLRGISAGFHFFYSPAVQVFHPIPINQYDRLGLDKAYLYGSGMGRVLRLYDYPWWFSGYHFLRPLGGCLLAIFQGQPRKAHYYWKSLQGRIQGWTSKPPGLPDH